MAEWAALSRLDEWLTRHKQRSQTLQFWKCAYACRQLKFKPLADIPKH